MSLSAFIFLAAAAAATTPQSMPAGDALRAEIENRDAALFWAAFEGCDPEAVEKILLPDYRMLHDLGGLAVPNRQAMVDKTKDDCAARGAGGENEGYKNRRQAVPGSRIVRKMGEWGALEEGAHVFFEWRRKEKRWELVGGARYMHVWRWMPDEGEFRLSESLSYDHGAAAAYPPAATKPED